MDETEFRELIWQRGSELYRDMPWRDEPTFYYVLVSELMLQQTQVSRVRVKFAECIEKFPDIASLASAPLAEVLRMWQGLGYNRRAKYLHQAAQLITSEGEPTTMEQLTRLPGIGVNTAAAIMNYVYEIPTAYVETNIRTVYFHHFYQDRSDISDREVRELVAATMDHEQPRAWFWALMDYGSDLKRTHGARLDQGRHYHKQSPLHGSVRELRGQIVAQLTIAPMTLRELATKYEGDRRLDDAVSGLIRDGLIENDNDRVCLTN